MKTADKKLNYNCQLLYSISSVSLFNHDFKHSNLPHSRYCPFYKTVGILKNMIGFHDLAKQAVEQSSDKDSKVTWQVIKECLSRSMTEISQMKFKDPVRDGEEDIKANQERIYDEMRTAFMNLED